MSTGARIVAVGAAAATIAALAAAVATDVVAQDRTSSATTLTIYGTPAASNASSGGPAYGYGGIGYGGAAPVAAGLPAPKGFAIVRETRTIELTSGITDVRWTGVAAGIEPGSVQFESLTDPDGTAIVEQQFRNDAATPDAVLTNSIGSRVTVVTDSGTVTGTLRALDPAQLVVDSGGAAGQVHVIRRGESVRDIRVSAPPDGLTGAPTLVWKVRAAVAGPHEVRVGYRATGVTWSADYSVVWNERAGRADLDAWVTIENTSGIDFDEAAVRLVTAPAPRLPGAAPASFASGAAPTASATSWLDSDVLEVPGAVSARSGGSHQVGLLRAQAGVRARRVLVHDSIPGYGYYATGYPNMDMYAFNYQARATTADIYLEIDGAKRAAMPAGVARLYRRTTGRDAELVAHAPVEHTPAGAPVRVRIGAYPKLDVAHSQLEFRLDERAKHMREKVEVKLANRGKVAVEVIVREIMWRWTEWSIEAESTAGTRAGPLAREYRVTVPAGKSRRLTYTTLYRW